MSSPPLACPQMFRRRRFISSGPLSEGNSRAFILVCLFCLSLQSLSVDLLRLFCPFPIFHLPGSCHCIFKVPIHKNVFGVAAFSVSCLYQEGRQPRVWRQLSSASCFRTVGNCTKKQTKQHNSCVAKTCQ